MFKSCGECWCWCFWFSRQSVWLGSCANSDLPSLGCGSKVRSIFKDFIALSRYVPCVHPTVNSLGPAYRSTCSVLKVFALLNRAWSTHVHLGLSSRVHGQFYRVVFPRFSLSVILALSGFLRFFFSILWPETWGFSYPALLYPFATVPLYSSKQWGTEREKAMGVGPILFEPQIHQREKIPCPQSFSFPAGSNHQLLPLLPQDFLGTIQQENREKKEGKNGRFPH